MEKALGKTYGKTSKIVYEKLTTDNPIDLVRYPGCQLLHGVAAASSIPAVNPKARVIWRKLCAPR